jgi:hypothetical protein
MRPLYAGQLVRLRHHRVAQSNAGNAFHATPASGLLKGMIAAHTPTGARSVRTARFGIGLVIVFP